MDDPAHWRIVSARVKMLFLEPDLGMRMAVLEPVPANATGKMTTDGNVLFYDPAWVLGLPVAEVLRLMTLVAATLPKWVAPTP